MFETKPKDGEEIEQRKKDLYIGNSNRSLDLQRVETIAPADFCRAHQQNIHGHENNRQLVVVSTIALFSFMEYAGYPSVFAAVAR